MCGHLRASFPQKLAAGAPALLCGFAMTDKIIARGNFARAAIPKFSQAGGDPE
jgi:hypothetical protein